MEKDFITERLKFLLELFKLVWFGIFAITGAAVSLLLGPLDRWRYLWAGVGLIGALLLAGVLWHTHRQMKPLWTALQKGEKQ